MGREAGQEQAPAGTPAWTHADAYSLPSDMLAGKLTPLTARANLVPRAGVDRLLGRALSAGLTLVSAQAGFGKTTLLAEWVADRPRTACWLLLDAMDNDPARFLAYLIAALHGDPVVDVSPMC